MENDKVNQLEKTTPQTRGLVFTPEEKKRLADYFTVLIEIDRRENVIKSYGKSNTKNSKK